MSSHHHVVKFDRTVQLYSVIGATPEQVADKIAASALGDVHAGGFTVYSCPTMTPEQAMGLSVGTRFVLEPKQEFVARRVSDG